VERKQWATLVAQGLETQGLVGVNPAKIAAMYGSDVPPRAAIAAILRDPAGSMWTDADRPAPLPTEAFRLDGARVTVDGETVFRYSERRRAYYVYACHGRSTCGCHGTELRFFRDGTVETVFCRHEHGDLSWYYAAPAPHEMRAVAARLGQYGLTPDWGSLHELFMLAHAAAKPGTAGEGE
jgi:hypothetical protein